jgi:hypothetical protein
MEQPILLKTSDCQRRASKNYRIKHPDKIKQISRDYYNANAEDLRRKRRERYVKQKVLKSELSKIKQKLD